MPAQAEEKNRATGRTLFAVKMTARIAAKMLFTFKEILAYVSYQEKEDKGQLQLTL